MTDLLNKVEPTIEEKRALLRQRFLTINKYLEEKPVLLELYDQTVRPAVYYSSDIDFSSLLVTNLETPVGLIDNALIRHTDIIGIRELSPRCNE